MKIKNPFRSNEISLNRIHHTVTVNENGEKLKLVINADPMRIVAGLNKAQKKLKSGKRLNSLLAFFSGRNRQTDFLNSMRTIPLA